MKTFPAFIKLLEQTSPNIEEFLFQISIAFRYEMKKENNLIISYGEKGKNFYLILDGEVAVFVPEKTTLELTQEEYFEYLINLKIFNQQAILAKCILMNRHLYNLDEDEIEWFKGNLITLKSRKKNSPLENYLFKLSVRDFTESFKDENFDIWQAGFIDFENKLHLNKNILSIDFVKYLTTMNARNKSENTSNSKKLDIFIFNKVTVLSKGDKFGDIGLISSNQKRNATIITETECHFGILDKNSFFKCLGEAAEILNRKNLTFILSQKIFFSMNIKNFQSNYFNLFVNLKLKRGEKLCFENSEAVSLFIIKDGEFEITGNKSYIELCELINYFDGKCHKLLDPLDPYRGINYNKFL